MGDLKNKKKKNKEIIKKSAIKNIKMKFSKEYPKISGYHWAYNTEYPAPIIVFFDKLNNSIHWSGNIFRLKNIPENSPYFYMFGDHLPEPIIEP